MPLLRKDISPHLLIQAPPHTAKLQQPKTLQGMPQRKCLIDLEQPRLFLREYNDSDLSLDLGVWSRDAVTGYL